MTKGERTISRRITSMKKTDISNEESHLESGKSHHIEMRLGHKENSQNKTYNYQTELREIQGETTNENTRYKMKSIPPHRDNE